jgi:prepilin-type N-terminal cleavage/methylation domain-containing protein
MLKIRKMMQARGFTLVELLIVIAIIGILAVAVLAALDPIEQLKKSRDTGRLSDARELFNAYTRYYASYNCYPEERSGGSCVNDTWAELETLAGVGYLTPGSGVNHVTLGVTDLVTSGELKTAFASKQSITNAELFVYQDADDQMAVCFTPESKSARASGMGAVLEADFTSDSVDCTGLSPYDASVISATCTLCVR